MAWVHRSTHVTNYKVLAADWNESVNNDLFHNEVGYTEFTSDVAVTATTVGTANQIVSSGAITYENVAHWIEFFCTRYTASANLCNLDLFDGSTCLGTLTQFPASQNQPGVLLKKRITPTAASHTYNLKGWMGGATTGTFKAGTGGAAGDLTTLFPGYIRIVRVPT